MRVTTPPDIGALGRTYFQRKDYVSRMLAAGAWSATLGDKYVHWDRLRFRTPPPGVTLEEWWLAIKSARMSMTKQLPCKDAAGEPFALATPDPLLRYLSEADRDLSGRVPIPEQLLNPGTRDRYRVSASIEEAITSSQLEGASTTRRVAAEMLRSGRKPTDRGERMIFNNYQAIRFIREMQKDPLAPDAILELHRIVTDQTLDDPADSGRLRTSDEVAVVDAKTEEVLHQPPKAAELRKRLAALCDLANEKTPKFYVHPIVRAILLHFFLAYDHPFVDGNGRTARALFYWSMARSGYWLCEFLSISHFLRKAPAEYAHSYLYTETDANDTTYFVLSQLATLKKAIAALHDYVRLKMGVIQRAQSILRQSHVFNHRQLALLGHAMQNPGTLYSATAHAGSHQVTPMTARSDLNHLAKAGLLIPIRAGRGFLYSVPTDLEDRLDRMGEGRKSGP
ncbi:MAG: Fic family protein [Planctomycetes bacterium]|nr:Fic family protein [Planctomycetota bacterium]